VVIPDAIIRQKMALLIEMEKFDPENPELVSLLSTFSLEDIDIWFFLVKNARAEELQWHDGQSTCVSISRNQQPVSTCVSISRNPIPSRLKNLSNLILPAKQVGCVHLFVIFFVFE
jgi:hypothetical protein